MTELQMLLLGGAGVVGIGFLMFIFAEPIRGLYAAICASAILIAPNLPVVREKISACEVVILMAWLIIILKWPGRARNAPLMLPTQKRAIGWGAALIAVCIISFAVSMVRENIDPTPAAVETANYIYGFMLFLTVAHLVTTWKDWVNCFYAWATGTALACSVGLYSLATGGPDWTRDEFTGRLSATFKFSNQLPSYCLPILAFVLVVAGWRSTRPWMSLVLYGLAAAIIANIIGTGSRIAFGMLILTLGAISWLAMQKVNRALFRASMFRWMGLGLIVGFSWFIYIVATQEDLSYKLGETPASERPIRQFVKASEDPDGEIDTNRARQIRTVIERFPERPIFGTGPHNVPQVFRMHEIHNTYLGALAETGILGFISLMAFIIAVGVCGWHGMRHAGNSVQYITIMSVLIGYSSLLLYGVAMFGLRQRVFWFMCGLLVALPRVLYSEHLARARFAETRRRRNAAQLDSSKRGVE
jgi:O-antigen ligase